MATRAPEQGAVLKAFTVAGILFLALVACIPKTSLTSVRDSYSALSHKQDTPRVAGVTPDFFEEADGESLAEELVPFLLGASGNASISPEVACQNITRVLITGVSGMIGSHVARVLVSKSCYKIYGLVRPRSNLDTLVGVLDKIILLTGDITDGPRITTILEEIRPDYLYHFAAQAINSLSYGSPEVTLNTNVIGTMNILEAVHRPGLETRILLAGSSTEYGRTADTWDGPIPESAPLNPVSPYGVSKVTTEKLGNQYFLSYGINVITARFFIQVGVGGTDSLAIHQFCKQIALAEMGLADPVVRHGNLKTQRDMTDVRDSAFVVVELAEKGSAGEAYNIGSGRAMTIEKLLNVAMSLSKVPVKAVKDKSRFRVYDEKILLADNSKVRALTGWTPRTNMRATVNSILHYWRRRVSSLYQIQAKLNPLDPVGSALLSPQQEVSPLCPTANIDIFFVTYKADFPLATFLIQSIHTFMPCHGHIHIFVDAGDLLKIRAWVDTQNPRIHLHVLKTPTILDHLSPYIAQAWAMMWADAYAKQVNSTADFMMFLDTDSMLGLPVTCRSLFSDDGKLYIGGWDLMSKQPQFAQSINDMVGPGKASYMSFLPFTMPISTFSRMRGHISHRLNGGTDFDQAFAEWSRRPKVSVKFFTQFGVMGTYLEMYEKDLVQAIFCHKLGQHKESDCARWVPPGTHFGWRPCGYLESCMTGKVDLFRRRKHGEFDRFTPKWGSNTIGLVEELIADGTCFMHYMNTTEILPGCTKEQSTKINAELLHYPRDPPSDELVQTIFKPDDPQAGLCYSVETLQRSE